MTFAYTYEVPIGPDVYAEIRQGLGSEPPEGLVVHIAHRTEGGLRYVDVWRSEEDWKRFVEGRLHPVVDRVLQSRLGFRPPEPHHEEIAVVDTWLGAPAG